MSDSVISPQSALVYLMVIIAAADSRLAEREIDAMSHSVSNLPVFRGFDRSALYEAAQACSDILQEREGLATVLALVRQALPDALVDTAYALACTMAASDGETALEELRLLDIIRHELSMDRLVATAIERGVVALNRPMPA